MNTSSSEEKLNLIGLENEKLKAHIAELSDFIENGTMPLHWVNADGIIIWANQAELELLGYAREEYVGLRISYFHCDESVINDILFRLSNNETLLDYPARLRCKDGAIKHVNISSNARFEQGQFIHSRCFTKDVTHVIEEEERKKKLLFLLKESEERLSLAIQATHLGTWDWDFNEGKILFSQQTLQILGHELSELNYQNVLALVHPEDRSIIYQEIKKLRECRADSHLDFVCRILQAKYKTRWIRVQGATFFSDVKRPRRIIGSILDITDLKKSMAESAELAAIINSSNDAIIGKTLDGIITSWNSAAEELFGYRAEEMIGKSILQVIPDDRKEEEDFILQRLKRGEFLKHFETKRLSKAGKLIDVSLSISPIKDDNGSIIGASKIARDITAKKQEERRKNDFVSIVSHELKTPLSSILLFAQVLQRKYAMKTDEIVYLMSGKIETQTKKMISMIGDFLSLAKIEEGKLQIRKTNFSIKELFEEAKEEAQLLSSKHEINIICEQPVILFADRDKIGQVLTNLVSNAIKYSPAGGRITIGCENQEGKAAIYISDEGIGISEKDQKKLFERFYRVESEETAGTSGIGIGLFIVAEIIRCHNSAINVESKKGKGTTFRFSLDQAHQRMNLIV